MNSIAANGISLNVQRLAAPAHTAASQEKPATVVCVHGLVLDNLSSYYFTLAKPLVLAGANVVMYDLRGYGRSSVPAHGYKLCDHVADLVGLLDSLALTQPVHLIGNSFGGTIALATAATHPQRVASIVAIEAFPPTVQWAVRVADMLDRGLAQLKDHGAQDHGGMSRTGQINRPGARRAARAMRDVWQNTSLVAETAAGPWLDPAELSRISCPVLYIFGGDSELAADAAAMRQLIPQCEPHVFAGYDHFVLVGARHAVAELVVPWLAEAERRLPTLPDLA
jgi:3-oxoadipate enol-lactonase